MLVFWDYVTEEGIELVSSTDPLTLVSQIARSMNAATTPGFQLSSVPCHPVSVPRYSCLILGHSPFSNRNLGQNLPRTLSHKTSELRSCLFLWVQGERGSSVELLFVLR